MSQQARRLGIIGGTFDPIHIGHLIAASEVVAALSLDEIVFVPAGRPWQKSLYSPAEDRLMMTTLAIADHERFSVSRIELDRRGPTYSADTLSVLQEFYGPRVELYFVMGSDTAAGISTWHKLDRFLELARVVVVTRRLDGDTPTAPADVATANVTIPSVDVSSTEIRARVREGRPISYLVPPPVERYIRDKGLYSTSAEVSEAESAGA